MDDRNPFGVGESPTKARRRIMTQGVNILHSIVEAYNYGHLDDPDRAINLCTMFALVAEGKVTGNFDDETGTTKWSLTDNYMSRLREAEEIALGSKLIKGPWKKTVDKPLKS